MKQHELSSISKKTKRVGRGGKRGTTSGRGTKGQHSRSGRRIRPAERDLILRIPKKRGFRNKPQAVSATVFNVGFLADKLKKSGREAGFTISMESLMAMKLISGRFTGIVKILGGGEVSQSFNVKGIKVSKEASQKIEKAGGKISA